MWRGFAQDKFESGAMDVILKVLTGAKPGTKIAVKKDKFLIGRSPKCHLCAAHNSVSRQHCLILRRETAVLLKDLDSRNGTLINGHKITPGHKIELTSGDELEIGSLRFLVTISHGIKNLKKSQVKNVTEAALRTAEKKAAAVAEEDITNWLNDEPSPREHALSDTRTHRTDETSALPVKTAEPDASSGNAPEQTIEDQPAGADKAAPAKQEPAQLPAAHADLKSKDSSQAAVEALRSMSRRH